MNAFMDFTGLLSAVEVHPAFLRTCLLPPVSICAVNVFIHIAAKLFGFIGRRTNIELAFVDGEGHWIDIPQFAFFHVVSAKSSVLRNISGRLLVERGFVGLRREAVDRTRTRFGSMVYL